MKKQLLLALFGYCVFLGSLAAQTTGNPDISIDLTKTGVLYVGLDNPVEVHCEGVGTANVRVQCDKGIVIPGLKGSYSIRPNIPGEIKVSVFVNGVQKYTRSFRAKRIPDPVPALGGNLTVSDTIPAGKFKAQLGIGLLLQNFDIDAKCDMVSFKITHISDDHVEGTMFTHSVFNKGARFTNDALDLINAAEAGDTFIFNEIKATCPGDNTARTLNALVFFIENSD